MRKETLTAAAMGVAVTVLSAGALMLSPVGVTGTGSTTVAMAAVDPKTTPIDEWMPDKALQAEMVTIANQERLSDGHTDWPGITTSNLGQYAAKITGGSKKDVGFFKSTTSFGGYGENFSNVKNLEGMQYFTKLEEFGIVTSDPDSTFSNTDIKFAPTLQRVTILGYPGGTANRQDPTSSVSLQSILNMFSRARTLQQIFLRHVNFNDAPGFPDLSTWKRTLNLADFNNDNLTGQMPDLSDYPALNTIDIANNGFGDKPGTNRMGKLPNNPLSLDYSGNFFGSGVEQSDKMKNYGTPSNGANQIITIGEDGDGGTDGHGKVFELSDSQKSFEPLAVNFGGMADVSDPTSIVASDPFELTPINSAGAKIVQVSDTASGTDYFNNLDLENAKDVTSLFDITYNDSDKTAANPSGLKLTTKDLSKVPAQGTYAIKVKNKNTSATNQYSAVAFMRIAHDVASITPGNTSTPITRVGGGGTTTPAPTTTAPHTVPTVNGQTGLGVTTTIGGQEVAVKGQAVYALKGIYMYKSKNFTANARRSYYAKARRVNRPMFVVTGYSRANNGALRYVVRDVNHKRHTDGWRGYITANAKYVVPVYYASLPKSRVITVINKTGVNAYTQVNLAGKAHHYKKGAHLKVVKIVRYHLTTRYVLSNGNYVTANKKLVIAGKF